MAEEQKKDRGMYDSNFLGYVEDLDTVKVEEAHEKFGRIDLSTPEGIKEAQRVLSDDLDIHFRNAEKAGKEGIEAVLKALQKHGKETPEEEGTLYSKRVLGRKYEVKGLSAEKLTEYRKRVEEIVAVLKMHDREKIQELLAPKGGKTRGDIDFIMETLESGKLTEEQYILFGIAILVGVNRSKGLSTRGSAIKLLTAGEYRLDQVLEKEGSATCIDVSTLAKVLALSYGIRGDIYVIGNKDRGHRFFVAAEDKGVIDGWHPALFVPSMGEFKDSVQKAPINRDNYDAQL